MESVSISVCTESIKHQKENVPNINRPTTLMGGGGNTHTFPTCSLGAYPPPPFPTPVYVEMGVHRSLYIPKCIRLLM